MKGKGILLSIDLVGQLILLILLGGSVVVSILSAGTTLIFTGLVLFFLGLWQVGSGLLFGIIRSDGRRAEYVVKSIIYVCVLFFGSFLLDGVTLPMFFNWFLIILFFLVIPSGIANWYYQYSQKDLAKLKTEERNQIPTTSDLDDILDSEEILRHERT